MWSCSCAVWLSDFLTPAEMVWDHSLEPSLALKGSSWSRGGAGRDHQGGSWPGQKIWCYQSGLFLLENL